MSGQRVYWCVEQYDIAEDRFYRKVYVWGAPPLIGGLTGLAVRNEVELLEWMGDTFADDAFDEITSAPIGSVVQSRPCGAPALKGVKVMPHD